LKREQTPKYGKKKKGTLLTTRRMSGGTQHKNLKISIKSAEF
jgi:hypothetical protein